MDAGTVAAKLFTPAAKKAIDANIKDARPRIAKVLMKEFNSALEDVLSGDMNFDLEDWYELVVNVKFSLPTSAQIKAIDKEAVVEDVLETYKELASKYIDSKQDKWAWGMISKFQKAVRAVSLTESVLVDDVMKEEIDPKEVGI